MRIRRAALAAALMLAVTACGIRPTGVVDVGGRPNSVNVPSVTLFLVQDGRLTEVRRPGLPDHPDYGVTQLGAQLTPEERRRGLTTTVPKDLLLGPYQGRDEPRALEVVVNRRRSLPRLALAQLACTAEEIRGIEYTSVQFDTTGMEPGEMEEPAERERHIKYLRCADYADLR